MKVWQTIAVGVAVVAVPLVAWGTFRINQCRSIEKPMLQGVSAIEEFYLSFYSSEQLPPLTPARNAQLIEQMERQTIPGLTRLTLYDSQLNQERSNLVREYHHWLSVAKNWYPKITIEEISALRGNTGRVEGARSAVKVLEACWIENRIYQKPL